jgi:hypothetical protein
MGPFSLLGILLLMWRAGSCEDNTSTKGLSSSDTGRHSECDPLRALWDPTDPLYWILRRNDCSDFDDWTSPWDCSSDWD